MASVSTDDKFRIDRLYLHASEARHENHVYHRFGRRIEQDSINWSRDPERVYSDRRDDDAWSLTEIGHPEDFVDGYTIDYVRRPR